MRIIKLAILSFFFLFLLVTGISLFIPSNLRISKAINMQTDTDSVYNQISVLKNWKNWHPALRDLSDDEFVFSEDGSMQIRNDRLKITQVKNDEIVTELTKDNGRPIISRLKIISHQQSDSLTVQWYFDFQLRWYPWEKFRSLFYENIYGVQMEQGLANLKQLMEDRRLSIN